MNKRYITWADMEIYITQLCKTYSEIPLTGVYGVPRGGIVLATVLSYRLGIPFLLAPTDGCLVVDDISDSGHTLLHYKEKGYKIATVVYNETSVVRPDSFYITMRYDWVIFCWEQSIESVVDSYNDTDCIWISIPGYEGKYLISSQGHFYKYQGRKPTTLEWWDECRLID